ncbi:hypothetical protein J4212_06590 [Candidatus Woesearchaeota archaeon]|nr:hypothetical protein [Candidatus Woesearchaeota archaeon]
MGKFKIIILAVAIAIIFALFIGFGISTFYKAPKYEDFCKNERVISYGTQEACEKNRGRWNENVPEKPIPVLETQLLCNKAYESGKNVTLNCQTKEQLESRGYCDMNFYCNQEFQKVNEVYNRNVFIVTSGIGIIILIVGFSLNVMGVSAGLMGGGILTFLYGTIRFWNDLPDYGRFIILGIALAILIWLGYKKLSR